MLSAIASAWLLFQLARLPGKRKAKLLARQLWHLALADLLGFVLFTVGRYHQFRDVIAATVVDGSTTLCYIDRAGDIPLFVSAVIEVHIAVAGLLATFRSVGTSKVLRRTLVLTWPIGIALGVVELVILHLNWDEAALHCKKSRSIMRSVCFLACAVTCCFLYGIVVYRRRKSSGAVRARAIGYAMIFVAANAITQLPNAIRIFINRAPTTTEAKIFGSISVALFGLGGLANACVYAVVNRSYRSSARSLFHRQSSQRAQPQQVREGSQSGQSHDTERSFPVEFTESAEVRMVDNIFAEAGRNAANDMIALDAGRQPEMQEGSEDDFLDCFEELHELEDLEQTRTTWKFFPPS